MGVGRIQFLNKYFKGLVSYYERVQKPCYNTNHKKSTKDAISKVNSKEERNKILFCLCHMVFSPLNSIKRLRHYISHQFKRLHNTPSR